MTATIQRVAVVGSGRMAPGIASACMIAGADVVIAARDLDKAAAAARSALDAVAGARAAGGVEPSGIEPGAFDGVDVTIETIAEDLRLKAGVYERIEPWLPPTAVLATNTSSFPITALAERLQRPGRFAGFHFLNPAHATAVVEVVPGVRTEAETSERLGDLARRMGKLPLTLRRDVPGFIWNRLQYAVLRECLHLLEEGVASIESIDAAVSDGLAPRWLGAGPFATADLGGLATFAAVADQLLPQLSRTTSTPATMTERATGARGFYIWDDEREQAVAELRAQGLAAAEEWIQRRRAAMPPADEP